MTTQAPVIPSSWRTALRTALAPWLVARALVAVAWLAARVADDRHWSHDPLAHAAVRHGLLSWDGAFYADIAQRGYAGLPREALRFFPLTPLAGRAIGWLGIGPRTGVVVVANLAALVATTLLVLLVRREGFDAGVATRAAWLLALAPPAFVLVFGYAEGLYLAAAVGILLCARDRRWWIAAALGVLAGPDRPGGFVVAVPVAVEALRGFPTVAVRERVARIVAVVTPFLGVGAYLAWVGDRFGDALIPFRVQTHAHLKGAFTDPVTSTTDAVRGLFHGHIGTGLHIPWMIGVVALIVVCFRRLPFSYGALATATVASAVTSANLDSFERYALGAFPIVIALALLVTDRIWSRVVIVASAGLMTAYATLALLHHYVP
ncbi:MAG: hypothetical protein ACXVJA_04315 [Acidimicrobiia bacterium]